MSKKKKKEQGRSAKHLSSTEILSRKVRRGAIQRLRPPCSSGIDPNGGVSDKSTDYDQLQQTIIELRSKNDQLTKEIADVIDHYKNEIQKQSAFSIDQVVICYNHVLSMLYYGIFNFEDRQELRSYANHIVCTDMKKLMTYGIDTQVFIPGSAWKDSDCSNEPTFIPTTKPELNDTICNCELFGLSFKNDCYPSTLAEIEVYKYSSNDEAHDDGLQSVDHD